MKYINHVEPVAPRQARGLVADVYAEARHDFGRLPEPVTVLSPHEGLLAAGWAALRETLIAGQAPRAGKEAVAAAVAATLSCPWCVDAHTAMLYAAGETATAGAILADEELPATHPHAPYVAWARGTATPSGPEAPFGPDEATGYIGTAMLFHFVVRLVSVLLDDTFLIGGARTKSLMRRAGGLVFARKVRATYPPGLASDRLPTRPLPEDLAWAATSPPVATAFAALTACLDEAQHLPAESREAVDRAVDTWRGAPPSISSSWTTEHTDELAENLRPATRLALLTALAPYQVTDADVAAARPLLATDAALVTGLAWAAWTATRRIGSWINRPAGIQARTDPN
jgi:AhpD family alkylhydroperoxidase